MALFKKKEVLAPPPRPQAEFHLEKETEISQLPDFAIKRDINVKYPLISPYAYVHIHWDDEEKEVIYELKEPPLTSQEQQLLKSVELGIEEIINISFLNIKDKNTVISYLEKNIMVLLSELGIKPTKETFLKIMYYVYRDFVGLNKIEPLMKDYYIEDIECNGTNTPIYIVHRKYRNLKTNITFDNLQELTSFVEKLAQKCGKYISYANPILDGRLPDKSRANATYTQEISSRGPTFTIRRFTTEPWSPVKLIQVGTASPEVLAYLWLLIEHESNFIVIGGTGSGKTSFLNGLAFFIPPEARIVSIEDTHELQLMHENWLPSVTREATGVGAEGSFGEISLFRLLKESFRQRPDYVIVGEVRGQEAYVLFQGAASIKGNEKILVLNDNHPKRIPIKDLRKDIKYKAICVDPILEKTTITPIKYKIEHKKRKKLYSIKTKSGREVTITPDHSLFTYKNRIEPITTKELKKGDKIVIPGRIPCGYADIEKLYLPKYLPDIRIFAPEYIRLAVKKLGYDKCCKITNKKAISDYYANFSKNKQSSLEYRKFVKLMNYANIDYDKNKIKIRYKFSKFYNSYLELSEEFLRFLGYYLSEGSLNYSKKNKKISLYNNNKKVLQDMRKCIHKLTGENPKERITYGFGSSTELSFTHNVICKFIKKYCGHKNKKRIPDFIFGLSKEKIGHFLSALYEGDGFLGNNCFGYYTISKELANDVSQILLSYGIVTTIINRKRKNRRNTDYEVLFFSQKDKLEFLKYASFRDEKSNFKVRKKSYHERLTNDLFLDEVKSIQKINLKKPVPVYDISIPGVQNFIGGFGGVLLHNSGHPTACTMHAEDIETMIRRLETPPINLPPSLVETLDVVCVMAQTRIRGEEVRRLKNITEVISVGKKLGTVTKNTPFIWDPRTDKFYFKQDSYIFKKIQEQFGLPQEYLRKEFERRTKLLYEMYRKNISGYKEVQKIINAYYKTPEEVLKRFNID